MKLHKYWSLGALATMIGTFYTGYKDMKSAHKYFACSSLHDYGYLFWSQNDFWKVPKKEQLYF